MYPRHEYSTRDRENNCEFSGITRSLGFATGNGCLVFSEWQNATKTLNDSDEAFLNHLQQRYYNYYNAGLLTEGTILFSLVAPLLEHLGFHEPPFFVRSEVPVQLEVQERNEVYRGCIDVLVVRERLWILTVEAKHSKFAVDIALPQCFAYMTASPEQPIFGMVTNGSDFIVCKLDGKTYDFSEPFSLLSRQNRLYRVAAILSDLKDAIASAHKP
ncbi:MAG: type I restriction endonuclease subunit R [Leptolyngbya sp. SIO1D8]|nr:type I restriction endonuclease subunit R [Leptolyngbya sp. SIO1D8]